MHLTSWSEDHNPGLSLILARLQGLYPTPNIQTHLLHLSSEGEILGHVDNIEASGSWILGVSLGAERILRMESTSDPEDSFEVLLGSGSVYLQMQVLSVCIELEAKRSSRDRVRYEYKHSVLKAGKAGQRVSVMVRVSGLLFADMTHNIPSRSGPKGSTQMNWESNGTSILVRWKVRPSNEIVT